MLLGKKDNPLVPKKEVREPEDPRQLLRTRSSVSSFFERSRIKGGTRLVQAQEEFTRSLADLETAFAGLAEARVVKGQAIRMLEDAETIYATDAKARHRQLLEEQDAHEAAKQELEIKRMDRAMALARKKAEYQAFLDQQNGVTVVTPTAEEPASKAASETEKSQAQREFEADRAHAFNPEEARFDLEERIAEMVRKAGGEENLTAEQKAIIARMRQKLEDLIRESGYA